jgi:hypothetical protein
MIVHIKCELVANGLITAHGVFEQLLLKIARKDRPKLQCRSTHNMFKTQRQLAHGLFSFNPPLSKERRIRKEVTKGTAGITQRSF